MQIIIKQTVKLFHNCSLPPSNVSLLAG